MDENRFDKFCDTMTLYLLSVKIEGKKRSAEMPYDKTPHKLHEDLLEENEVLRAALRTYATIAERVSWDEFDDEGNLVKTITIHDGTAVAKEALGWER